MATKKVSKTEKDIPRGLETIAVNGIQLADFLGISPAKVTRLHQARVIQQDTAGRYNLRDCVRASYAYRNRAESNDAMDMERDAAEKLHWQAQNEKAKNREWRESYGMELAERYRDSIASLLDSVREFYEKRGDEEGAEFMESVATKIKSGDLHTVVAEASDMEEADADD